MLEKQDWPRERMLRLGPDNLSDSELLAILLRTGTKQKGVLELADEILKKHPLDKFLELNLLDLKEISGVETAKACTILASIELARRVLSKPGKILPVVGDPESAIASCPEFKGAKKEVLIALYLNGRNQLLHKEVLAIGSLSQATINPRDIFEPALRVFAGYIIMLHNHPSGNTEPSDEDLEFTEIIAKGSQLLGLKLLDHIVVGNESFTSIIEA